ncbi:uncharacterized protein MELLADRAFT_85990 [Melampsora larici-populina 98AG31]|uniref:Non-structural maintenance of chromosomes element 1 homolog n=1 Tax=Melampsora larici-populina (strain 98AG31 / pathotype 3-4-7) TaxID=747676 RepID=F4RKD7_MELLP|nr:uncharacterized protein MELLADRAFT_85990 [Melampsora larici-populina 98AG31]EGG07078.1 hypothetical protein MELLADRAFT_85990 [Melampsora larici-populina 98AG31]
MLLRRVAPYKTWDTIFKKCRTLVDPRDREPVFETLIRDINHRLEPLGFRIAQTVDGGIGPIDESQQDQVSDESGGGIYPRSQGERWMGLINTKVDNSAKLATELTPAELNFFRRVISRIIRAPNHRYCISLHEAIRSHTKIQGMKKGDAQNVLDVLVKKGWLSYVAGIYTLSIRAQLELDPYFEKTFDLEDLPPQCLKCKNIVMRGYKCPKDECRGALHVQCEAVWKRTQSKCSECKGKWSNETLIGQDAPDGLVLDTEEESEVEAKEEEEEEEEGTQQTQTQTQASKGKRRSTASSQKSQKKSRNREGPSQPRNGRTPASRRSSRYDKLLVLMKI